MSVNQAENKGKYYHEIFLSYKRADLYAVKLIEKYLVELDFPRPFFDMDILRTGEEYDKKICDAIMNCKDFILIISPNTFATKKGVPEDSYVVKEIKWALDNNVSIIPLLLDGASFPEESQLPESIKKLSRIHAAPLDFRLSLGEEYILDSLKKQFSKRLNTCPWEYKPEDDIITDTYELQMIQAKNLEKFDLEQIDEICELLAKNGRTEGLTVLDVGCGNGSCGRSRFAGPRFSKVIGIDTNEKKLGEAISEKAKLENDASADASEKNKYFYEILDVNGKDRSKTDDCGSDTADYCFNIADCIEAVMDKHDIEDGFDIIFVANVLHLLEKPSETLKGLNDVLRPGGYIFTRCADDRMKVADGDGGLLREIITGTRNLGIKADREAGRKQYAWLENASFRQVKIKTFVRTTDGLERKQKKALFRESFEWRRKIAEDIRKDAKSPRATREICDKLIADIDRFASAFTDRNTWYCEVDIAAIATK